MLEDMSNASGPSLPGTAMEIGFVPKKGSAPPHGEMAAFALPIVMPTNPCPAAWIV